MLNFCLPFQDELMSKESIALAPYSKLRMLKLTPVEISNCKTVPWDDNCGFQTAYEYFQETEKFHQIKFGVNALDRLTDGGVDVGSVTEIFGEAGSGKTQLCMQLALNCALPIELNGLNGNTCYISTDKHLPTNRLSQIANALTEKHKIDVSFLDKINVWEFNTTDSLKMFVLELPALLEKIADIRLIVIDSIAGIFRHETNYIQRATDMRDIVQELERLADIYNFAIVTTNHVTSTPHLLNSNTIAACGAAWDNLVVTKLKIEKTEKIVSTEESEIKRVRIMEVIYSPRLACERTKFTIDSTGVVDI